MFKAIFTEIRKINIFGRDMQLEKDYTNKFNSIQSFVLSMLVFIATFAVGILIGEEIFKKERPKVTSSTTKIDVMQSEFNFSEFPVLIVFANEQGMPLSESEMKKMFSVVASIVQIDDKGVNITYSSLEECNADTISNIEARAIISERSKIFSGYKQYCIDSKWKLKNKIGTPNSLSVGLQINRCQHDCYENLSEKIEKVFGGITIINSFIDPSNFNSPIKFYDFAQTFILNTRISEQITFSFTKNELITNIGWIFDNYKKDNYISFKELSKSFFFSDVVLSRIVFESPLVVTQLTREYMKIQELIASIGGFFNACYLIISFLFGHYIKFDYYCYVDEKTKFIEIENNKGLVSKRTDDDNLFKNVKINNYINVKDDVNRIKKLRNKGN